MPAADGGAGLTSAPRPQSRGGGGSPKPSAPAPSSGGGGGGGSSAPTSSSSGSSSYVPQAAAPAAKKPNTRALLQQIMPGVDLSPQPTQPGNTDLLQKLTNPDFQYIPGAVDEAKANLKSAKADENGRPLPLVSAYGTRVSDPQEPTTSFDGTVQEARQDLQDAERARRARAVRPNIQGKGVGDVKRMTQEEYDALSDRERAAIDFNTMLVGSVRTDKQSQGSYDPSKKQEKRYDSLVSEMFGEDGGSDTYAPETVAMLEQIKFRDEAADLDDFLGLRAAITKKDMRNLKVLPEADSDAAADSLGEVKLERLSLTENLVDSTEQMQDALVKGNQLLSTINRTAGSARSEHVNMLGGDPRDFATLGFGQPSFEADGSPSNLDTYFQVAYDKMANAGSTKPGEFDTGVDVLRSDLSPAEFNAFLEYSKNRSTNAGRYGVELGDKPGAKYHSPETYRQLLRKAVRGGPAEPEPQPEPQQQQRGIPPQQQQIRLEGDKY